MESLDQFKLESERQLLVSHIEPDSDTPFSSLNALIWVFASEGVKYSIIKIGGEVPVHDLANLLERQPVHQAGVCDIALPDYKVRHP